MPDGNPIITIDDLADMIEELMVDSENERRAYEKARKDAEKK